MKHPFQMTLDINSVIEPLDTEGIGVKQKSEEKTPEPKLTELA